MFLFPNVLQFRRTHGKFRRLSFLGLLTIDVDVSYTRSKICRNVPGITWHTLPTCCPYKMVKVLLVNGLPVLLKPVSAITNVPFSISMKVPLPSARRTLRRSVFDLNRCVAIFHLRFLRMLSPPILGLGLVLAVEAPTAVSLEAR